MSQVWDDDDAPVRMDRTPATLNRRLWPDAARNYEAKGGFVDWYQRRTWNSPRNRDDAGLICQVLEWLIDDNLEDIGEKMYRRLCGLIWMDEGKPSKLWEKLDWRAAHSDEVPLDVTWAVHTSVLQDDKVGKLGSAPATARAAPTAAAAAAGSTDSAGFRSYRGTRSGASARSGHKSSKRRSPSPAARHEGKRAGSTRGGGARARRP